MLHKILGTLESPKACICIMVTGSIFSGIDCAVSILFEIFNFHLSYFYLVSKGIVPCQSIFKSQTTQYNILLVKWPGEIRWTIDKASPPKIFLFIVLLSLTSGVTTNNFSVFLFHPRPNIILLLDFWFTVCFAYFNSSFVLSLWLFNIGKFEFH